MKCIYLKICKLATDNSMRMSGDGSSSCGHFRTLSHVENKKTIQKKELKELNKLIISMEKSKIIAIKMSLRTIHKNSEETKIYDILSHEIENNIILIKSILDKKIQEKEIKNELRNCTKLG